jgi:hypothetical protein
MTRRDLLSHLPVLFLLVLLLRAFGFHFGVTDNDETDFLIIAKVMQQGGLPYVDAFDHKPPLLYALYLPSTWHMWPMQLLAVFWVTATAVVLGLAAERLRQGAGIAAAYLCVILSACNTLSVNAELLLNLPAAVALYFLIAEREFAFGLAVGIASLIKHQAGILLLAAAPRPRRWPLVAAGFVIPWALAVAVYAHHLDAFWEWNITRNLHYSSQGTVTGWLLRFLEGHFGYGLGAAPLPWYLAIRNSKSHRGLAIALFATIIPVSLGGRFYNHYYMQFIPPLSLLAAVPLTDLLRAPTAAERTPRRLMLALLVAPVLVTQIVHVARNGDYPSQESRSLAVAEWLRSNSDPSDRVVIYGHFTPIYQMARRMPGSRYLHTSSLYGNFDATQGNFVAHVSRRDEDALISDLRTKRPKFFLDTSTADIKGWSKLPLSLAPELARVVNELYEPVASPAGVTVYRLRSSAGSTSSAAHKQVTSPMSATMPNDRSAPLWARSSEL